MLPFALMGRRACGLQSTAAAWVRRGRLSLGPAWLILLSGMLPAQQRSVAPEGAVRVGTRYLLEGEATKITFELKATGHTVHGRAGRVEGWFRARPGGPTGAVPLEGEIRVAAAELSTGRRRRDAKMHRQSLAVGEHPWIVFTPARWERSAERAGEDRLVGVLQVRGVQHELEIPVRVEARGEGLVVAGAVSFEWSDFGVPDPSFLFLRVQEQMTVRFEAVFRPSGEAPAEPGRA